MPEIEKPKQRLSRGDGSQEKPYTFNPAIQESDSTTVIIEGATLSINAALNYNLVFFKLNCGTFSITRSVHEKNLPSPAFVAKDETKEEKSNPKDILKWGSYAVSVFTQVAGNYNQK